jgi:hypothetical protein
MRAESEGGGRSRRHTAACAVGVAFLVGLGCLNLDLPTVPATPPPPSLSVLTPKPGDTISLNAQVTVSAASVNGIGSVSVICGPPDAGGRTVYAWGAPPYVALVDFSPCEGFATPGPDGGLPLLPLAVRAISGAGALGEVELQVQFNAAGPVVSVLYPPSAQPKAPFTVVVTSDRPLGSFPTVVLDGLAATSVTAVANPDGGLPSYTVTFATTRGLGTDNAPYTPGVPVPIEILTDTSETVRLVVDATALNGNTTEVDLGVDITRVVWDRYLPGQPASSSPIQWAAEPVAFDQGLELPLSTVPGGGATGPWIPGVLSRADGTFFGFNPSLLDGGYIPRGLNSQGEVLAFAFTGNGSNLLLAPPPNVNAAPVHATGGPLTANAPLTRVDNLLCLQDSVVACSGETTDSLTCFNPQLTAVTAASGIISTGPPTPGVVAGAGGRYLSPNIGVCGSSWNLVDLNAGTVSVGPTVDPNGCAIEAIDKLLAVGDGTFVVQLTSNCSVTGVAALVYPILRVGAGSSILGAYTAPVASPSTVRAELVGALPDGRVVTLQNAPPYTNFQLWALNSTTPDVVTPIAGLYDTADDAFASVLAKSTYSASDGGFAVLLSGATLSVEVLAFGPSLQPLWLYIYPRATDATNSRLVAAASVGDVYLLDEFNNYAVSLRVAPQTVDGGNPGGGFTVSGYVVDSNGIPAPLETIVASSASGTQNAASDADGGFTFTNVAVPYTLSAVDLTYQEAVTYVGLTIPNPTIQLQFRLNGNRSGTFNLALDGGSPNDLLTFLFTSPEATLATSFDSPTGVPSLSVDWSGPASITGTVYALELESADGGDIPFGFAYGTLPGVQLQDGTTVNETLSLRPVPTGTLSGTLSAPEGTTLAGTGINLIPDGVTLQALLLVAFDGASPARFSYVTPSVPDSTLALTVSTSSDLGNGTLTMVGLAANTTGLAVTIPTTSLVQTAPDAGATGVTTSTQFSCTPLDGGIYRFSMNAEGASFAIWTASPTATIPDLSAAGLPLLQGTSYVWYVTGYQPLTSVDELAAPYSGNSFTISTPLIYFFTNP